MPDPISDAGSTSANSARYLDWNDGVLMAASLDDVPVSLVPIRLLAQSNSIRREGEDPAHIQMLAETETSLPPIVVHHTTMRVIDGMHRVRAAQLKGRTAIEARILDCDEETAFLLAVTSNVAHGLTLCNADRKTAAGRMLASHPEWSDRIVATATGLSARTVAAVRIDCSTADAPQSSTRLGKDGRARPLDSAESRRLAAEMLRENPKAGLREIARATGLSPATVSDVRQRANRGEDPVPDRYRRRSDDSSSGRVAAGRRRSSRAMQQTVDLDVLLAKLRNDPALRYNESGRQTLRWLYQHAVGVDSFQELVSNLPDHWSEVVAEFAASCAQSWDSLAESLSQDVWQPPNGVVDPRLGPQAGAVTQL